MGTDGFLCPATIRWAKCHFVVFKLYNYVGYVLCQLKVGVQVEYLPAGEPIQTILGGHTWNKIPCHKVNHGCSYPSFPSEEASSRDADYASESN